MKKTGIAEASDKVAEIASAKVAAFKSQEQTLQSAMVLGAAGTLKKLSEKFEAQTIRALIGFREAKGYEAFGFEDFADFLDNSPYSPMSRNQFYDRKKLLEAEGDMTYNLLNDLRVPVSTRKLLTNGSVRFDGENLFIGDECLPATDAAYVREKLQALSATLTQQEALITDQKEKIKLGERENRELRKKLDHVKPSVISDASSPYSQALVLALAALGSLSIEAENLSDDECLQLREEGMRLLSAQWRNLQYAYRFEQRPADSDSEEFIFNNQELDELDSAM